MTDELTVQLIGSLMQAHGIDIADLVRAGAATLGASTVAATPATSQPTNVADFLPRVVAACPAKALPTYSIGFRRLVASYGPKPLPSVTPLDLQILRDQVRRTVGEARVARARMKGHLLRSGDPDAYGRGAAENLVRAVRFFFRCAMLDGRVDVDPAATLRAPRRPDPPERPLTDSELAEVQFVCMATGNDPELDGLVYELLRHTACRREGTINLRLGDLHREDGSVTLTEKNGNARDLPLRLDLIRRLVAHAEGRGAWHPQDGVLRYKDGRPLTRRRFNTIFDRLDAYTSWSGPLDVGAHWIRHTTLDDVRRVADLRVAQAFAGHRDESLGPIGRYTKPTFTELVAAYEAIFGPRC